MDALSLPFNFRLTELLPVARLLRTSYVRDQTDFQDLLPEDYTPQFLLVFDETLLSVELVVRSSVAIAQRQVVTQRITTMLEGLPALLNRLEARVRRATGLTVPPKKFGIEATRRDRNNHEHEGLTDSLRTLLQNIEANKKALTNKGLPQVEIDQIQTLYHDLIADSTAQGSGLSDQRLLTADNAQLFRTLYAPMKEIMDDGKSIYKTGNPTKAKDYTLSKILQQVRKDHGSSTAETKDPEAA